MAPEENTRVACSDDCPSSTVLEYIHVFTPHTKLTSQLLQKGVGFEVQSIKDMIEKNKYHYWELTGDL